MERSAKKGQLRRRMHGTRLLCTFRDPKRHLCVGSVSPVPGTEFAMCERHWLIVEEIRADDLAARRARRTRARQAATDDPSDQQAAA